jgi:hypothetical protein
MYGAMDCLISDNAKAQIFDRVRDILRTFCIKDWQSEPYKGNQNFAERGWKDTKTRFNNMMNTTGASPKTWLLALKYTCKIQNHLAIESLNWRTPTEWLLGYTPDITVFLQFRFWEPVYYAKYDGKFPADSTEELGRFVGIGKHVGHAMTFKILTGEDKVIHRSVVRSATGTGAFINQKANSAGEKPGLKSPAVQPPEDTFHSEIQEDIIRAQREDASARGESIPIIDTANLLGRTFIDDADIASTQ